MCRAPNLPFIDTYLAGHTAHFPLGPEWAARFLLFMRYRMTLLLLSNQSGVPLTCSDAEPSVAAITSFRPRTCGDAA
jgi:hypothetical protein